MDAIGMRKTSTEMGLQQSDSMGLPDTQNNGLGIHRNNGLVEKCACL